MATEMPTLFYFYAPKVATLRYKDDVEKFALFKVVD